jgi:hypothetical protein
MKLSEDRIVDLIHMQYDWIFLHIEVQYDKYSEQKLRKQRVPKLVHRENSKIKIHSITIHTESKVHEHAPHAAMNESVRSHIVHET